MKDHSLLVALLFMPATAFAGPPFITDDPVPVELHHFETFYFTAGSTTRDGFGSASGIDFNYGLARDLHINIAVPYEYEHQNGGGSASGIGNIELAAKYRFLHQESSGWDVAVYPRVVLKAPATGSAMITPPFPAGVDRPQRRRLVDLWRRRLPL